MRELVLSRSGLLMSSLICPMPVAFFPSAYTPANPTNMMQEKEQLLCRPSSTGRLVLSESSLSECCCMRLLIGLSREGMETSPLYPFLLVLFLSYSFVFDYFVYLSQALGAGMDL